MMSTTSCNSVMRTAGMGSGCMPSHRRERLPAMRTSGRSRSRRSSRSRTSRKASSPRVKKKMLQTIYFVEWDRDSASSRERCNSREEMTLTRCSSVSSRACHWARARASAASFSSQAPTRASLRCPSRSQMSRRSADAAQTRSTGASRRCISSKAFRPWRTPSLPVWEKITSPDRSRPVASSSLLRASISSISCRCSRERPLSAFMQMS